MSENAHVIGVDVGTPPGRAVVVGVGDGAELGSAVHADEHAVVERALPATGQQLPPVDRIAGPSPVPAGRQGLLA